MDPSHYEELQSSNKEEIKANIKVFTNRWRQELDEFHPNVREWINNLDKSGEGKEKQCFMFQT